MMRMEATTATTAAATTTAEDDAKAKATKTKATKRKRQLKMEDFKVDVALPYVYNNFYDNFRDGMEESVARRRKASSPSGAAAAPSDAPPADAATQPRESTARSLRRLIQLYYRWQHWAFPGFAFRDFAERAQTFGGSYLFKRELDELRKEAINICSRQGLEPEKDEDGEVRAAENDAAPAARRSRMDWVDDDEDLLALQHEEVAQGEAVLDEMADDELNELLADEPNQTTPPRPAAAASAAAEAKEVEAQEGPEGVDDDDDEGLQELLAD
ncbi:Swi3 domain-containing protein [Chloropicon primus]|uniref:Chromosome segregation in meiosis protein 3 domain-containing protein n=1 Tax=Chloropicon primus TaxID=1764295 RepID=A0A5B8MVV7_9CHLO|nr:hypothetical protein A3770_13p70750 [Chloropicon primus]UPR03765.1 Swi3 domain-containing protein [Chloropicon primus]|mmetsp:Transcript_8154/g.23300  ORF Transcript_8154/g.23300 Transcript_8154/m.23300 type:complete len:271 (+) Transcript_8154:208-1020(+)|eukprot:QDZ24557.1 hypothetical protein A3770_13p70750 [Chloropicon primus]